MTTGKKLLFSVTADDCEWSYTRGSGNGGQKKNKTSSAVHCTHAPSGAHAFAQESRSQLDNKRSAFLKMIRSPTFEKWRQAESRRRSGEQAILDAELEASLKKVRVERKNQAGLWEEWHD